MNNFMLAIQNMESYGTYTPIDKVCDMDKFMMKQSKTPQQQCCVQPTVIKNEFPSCGMPSNMGSSYNTAPSGMQGMDNPMMPGGSAPGPFSDFGRF